MENEARRVFPGFREARARGDGIGIAVERVDRRAALEKRPGVAPGAESGIDDNVARLRVERGDDFVEQDGDVRLGHFLRPFPASMARLRQAACGPSQPSPIA